MNDEIHLLIARVRTETSGIAVVDDLCAEAESLAAKFKANVANLEFALIQRDEARGERDEAVKLAQKVILEYARHDYPSAELFMNDLEALRD